MKISMKKKYLKIINFMKIKIFYWCKNNLKIFYIEICENYEKLKIVKMMKMEKMENIFRHCWWAIETIRRKFKILFSAKLWKNENFTADEGGKSTWKLRDRKKLGQKSCFFKNTKKKWKFFLSFFRKNLAVVCLENGGFCALP